MFRSGKNNKMLYYAAGYIRQMLPRCIYQYALQSRLAKFDKLPHEQQRYVMDRVEYYCKITEGTDVGREAKELIQHTIKSVKRSHKVYYLDTYEFTRYFDDTLKWNTLFGDIIHVPDVPSITKSRPLCDGNENSIIMKLNKVRHFITLNDTLPFESKISQAIYRGDTNNKPHRVEFMKRLYNHPLCDLGEVVAHKGRAPYSEEWRREAISLYDHLKYKFVFTIEGNDVASNLKWVMSSNSLAVMPKPTCETWFMEGRLIGGEHYIEVAKDFSDVESQLQYYIEHPKEAKEIAAAANRYVAQFQNREIEDLISLMVLDRYFRHTGQK